MRTLVSASLTAAALTLAAMPAAAAWKSYVNRELGFSFRAPGEVKTDIGTFRGAVAGPRQTIIYKSVDNNIEYKLTVMSFLQAQAEGATILGEREYMFQDGKKVLLDTFGRVEPGKNAVYGRKIVIELPDHKGRRVLFHQGQAHLARGDGFAAKWRLRLARPRALRRFHRLRAVPHGPRCDRARDAQPRLAHELVSWCCKFDGGSNQADASGSTIGQR